MKCLGWVIFALAAIVTALCLLFAGRLGPRAQREEQLAGGAAAESTAGTNHGRMIEKTSVEDRRALSEPAGTPFPDDPAAHALYDRMVQHDAQGASLSYAAHCLWHGRALLEWSYKAWLKKPNYFRMETSLEKGATYKGGVAIGDGKDWWFFWPEGRWKDDKENPKVYDQTRLTSYMRCGGFASGGFAKDHYIGTQYIGPTPILNLGTFFGNTDSAMPYLDGMRSLPAEKVGSEECDLIEVSFMKHEESLYLWLSRREYLPRRLKAITRASYDLVREEDWSSVEPNGEIPGAMFAWTPPEGWKEFTPASAVHRLPKPGSKAPDFDLASADGGRIRLSDYRSKVVWFYIWRAG